MYNFFVPLSQVVIVLFIKQFFMGCQFNKGFGYPVHFSFFFFGCINPVNKRFLFSVGVS